MNYTEINNPQGSKEWLLSRFGRIGGSSASKVNQKLKSEKYYDAIERPEKNKNHQAIYDYIKSQRSLLPTKAAILEACDLKSDSAINTMNKAGSLRLIEKPLSGWDSLTDTSRTYMIEKITELITQVPNGMYYDEFGELRRIYPSRAMDWGNDYEDEARRYYEHLTGNPVKESGLLVHNKWPEISCSLDGMISPEKNLEIKCPYSSENHIKYFVTDKIPTEYFAQMQLGMAVTGAESCDFVSYDPRHLDGHRFKMYVQNVERNEVFIENIMTACINWVKVLRDKLNVMGLKGVA